MGRRSICNIAWQTWQTLQTSRRVLARHPSAGRWPKLRRCCPKALAGPGSTLLPSPGRRALT